ncbi:hypothetical protein DSM3645_09947 [Blastopirellula marina DSM 3645]|uniref:Uncharacterized protein n=1 Tax=Blastopirellula marina DSM 3645 TaxID=314230 RepID=A3ZLT0_9BACT|nr:hypothetical protein DSM3645_09947 [Blastopirellula marina DSM 3645]
MLRNLVVPQRKIEVIRRRQFGANVLEFQGHREIDCAEA